MTTTYSPDDVYAATDIEPTTGKVLKSGSTEVQIGDCLGILDTVPKRPVDVERTEELFKLHPVLNPRGNVEVDLGVEIADSHAECVSAFQGELDKLP